MPVGRSGDIVSGGNHLTKETYNIYSSTVNNITYPITPKMKWHNVEKVVKIEDEIFFIDTEAKEVIIE